MLRLAQLSPDQGDLELTVSSVANPDDTVLIAALGYGELSDYRTVEAGDYVIATRPAGSTEPPMVSKTISVQPGTTTTVATVGRGPRRGITSFTDDLTAPDPTQARVRVINAAPPATQLDVRGPVGGAGRGRPRARCGRPVHDPGSGGDAPVGRPRRGARRRAARHARARTRSVRSC